MFHLTKGGTMAKRAARTILFGACALCVAQVLAQAYPDRPIRVVVPFPPGGSTDFSARILAAHLPNTLKQTLVIDNRGGAGGNIGADIVAKAVPDGYTLLVAPEGPVTIAASLYPKLPYSPLKDLTSITQLIKYANVVVVNPTLKASSIKDLLALAKEQPGKLSYAHPGVGTNPHLGAELFKIMGGVNLVGVSYKGGGPAIVSVIGNETQVSFATAPSSIPHVKSGRLRAIAVTSGKRSAALPDLATIAESGVPGYNVEGWVGFFAPAKTSPKILARLHEEAVKVMRMQDVKDMVLASGSETVGNTADELTAILHAESAMWAKVVKTVGVKLE
jgi:tripartite-type tricarboxylate transporter receptor subunit TctC